MTSLRFAEMKREGELSNTRSWPEEREMGTGQSATMVTGLCGRWGDGV